MANLEPESIPTSDKFLSQTHSVRVFSLLCLLCTFFFYHVFGYLVRVCLCIVPMPGTHGGQERVSDLLEMELQTVVSHRVGTEDQNLGF